MPTPSPRIRRSRFASQGRRVSPLRTAFAVAALEVGSALAGHAQVLTFEGLQNLEPVGQFYNGGTGGNGSGPGPHDGITFGPNALALIEQTARGTGNFGGEPSPPTALAFTGSNSTLYAQSDFTLSDPVGFVSGFSFYYASPFFPVNIAIYDGPDATGNVLATRTLALTPDGSLSGKSVYVPASDPFVPFGVSFNGVAKSVNFSGPSGYSVFDNITLGSVIPQGPNLSVPEPSSLALLGLGMGGLALFARKRRRV